MVWTDFEPEIPDHCRDQGLCEDVPNYPQEYMEHLLRNNATVRHALSFTLGAYETERACKKPGEDPRIHELCAFTTREYVPKAAQDINGTWFYLLPNQYICLEVCKNSGTESHCSNKTISVNTGYRSICNQRHTSKRMWSLSGNGKVQYREVDNIKTGCCCQTVDKPVTG